MVAQHEKEIKESRQCQQYHASTLGGFEWRLGGERAEILRYCHRCRQRMKEAGFAACSVCLLSIACFVLFRLVRFVLRMRYVVLFRLAAASTEQ